MKRESTWPSCKVVIAIDFGTSRTGYQFAFTSAGPDAEVFPNASWAKAPEAEAKTLTELLLKLDGTPVAFGYEARNKFSKMKAAQAQEHLYFKNYKMALYSVEGGPIRAATVRATNSSVEMPVMKLIVATLSIVKEKALAQVMCASPSTIDPSHVLWVVTVPAIWDITARQKMLSACEDAGLTSGGGSIIIALEPEAASLCCLHNSKLTSPLDIEDSKYMVVDAGGGTVDITVHKKTGDFIAEIVVPSGGDWGSSYVNENFTSLLRAIFGDERIAAASSSSYWPRIANEFEEVKLSCEVGEEEDGFHSITISALTSDWEGEETPAELIEQYNNKYNSNIQIEYGMLCLPSSVIHELFEPMFTKITSHINDLLANPELDGLKYIFLVGGFAQSPLLRKKIIDMFSRQVKVVIPPKPGLAVGNGAVLYGMNPVAISSRIARYTVGTRTTEKWDQPRHDGHPQAMYDGGARCTTIFATFINAGESIDPQSELTREFVPVKQQQSSIRFDVYCSPVPYVRFTDEPRVKYIGELVISELPDQDLPLLERVVDVHMQFGGPTFSVRAVYRRTAVSVKAQFSFTVDEQMSCMSVSNRN